MRHPPNAPAVHDDRRLPALTGLRFFAALAVLVSHFSERGAIAPLPGLVGALDGGRTAVSLFFVLSGFVLAFNYARLGEPGTRRAFYVARFARIYPTVVLSLLIAAVGVTFAMLQPSKQAMSDWYSLTTDWRPYLAASLIGQLLMLVGWLPTARLNQPWNSPAWSISCEVFFYLLFPFILIALRRYRPRAQVAILGAVLVAQLVWLYLLVPLAPEGQRGFLAAQFPLSHLLEFALGIACGLIYLYGGREWLAQGRRRLAVLTTAVVPILLLAAFQPLSPAYVAVTPFFALLVLGLAASPRAGRRSWLAWKPLVLLGEASFALYMIHMPLLNIASISPALLPVVGWPLMVLVVLLSVVVFEFYENPTRRLLRRKLSRPRPRLASDNPARPLRSADDGAS